MNQDKEKTVVDDEGTPNNMTMAELLGEMRRMMREEIGQVNERIDRIERGRQEPPHNENARERMGRNRPPMRDDEWEEEDEPPRRLPRRELREENRGVGTIKLKIPSFQGKSDPEGYLEWEKRVEMIFDCNNYTERNKVRMAAIEFTNYALIWWDQLVSSRKRNGEREVSTWGEMKVIMRK